MSTINTNPINVNYPVPGVNNNSQGFRDNFASIVTNLNTAATELTDLQNKVVVKQALIGTTVNNDMANTLISNASTRSFRATTYNLGGALSGTVLVNTSLADVQYGTVAENTQFNFGSWAPAGTQSNVQLNLTVSNSLATITFSGNVVVANANNNGVSTLENFSNVGGLVTVTAPYGVTQLNYLVTTTDCGSTLYITPTNRPRVATAVQQRTPSPTGMQGDVSGDVAVDDDYFYICSDAFNSGGGNTVTKSNVITTTSGTNLINCQSTTSLVVNAPIIFSGNVFGGIVANATYYIKSIDGGGTSITISDQGFDGVAGGTFAVSTASGTMTATSYNGNTIWRRIGVATPTGNSTVNGNLTVTYAANIGTTLKVAGTANAGNLTTGGTLNVTGNSTVGNLTVTGTLIAGDIAVSSISNGTSNVDIVGVSGNVTTSVAGNANVLVVTGTGANITGTGNFSGNLNAANLIGTGHYTNNTSGNAQIFYDSSNNSVGAFQGNIANYIQAYIWNSNVNANASASFAVYDTVGPTGSNFVDIGILSNTWSNSAWTISGASDAYVYAGNSNLAIGTASSSNIIFFTGGTLAANERMRITTTGANITGTGNFSGNLSAANLIGPHANGNSNVNIPAANGNVNISAVGVANILVVTGTGVNVAGTLNTGTGIITTTGNITGGNLMGPHANGNSNVNIATSNGNVTITAVGNTTLTITGTGANITGTANISGNANVGNIGATNAVIATAANIPLIQNGTSNITITNNGNVSLFANGNSTAQLVVANGNVTIGGYALFSAAAAISAAGTVQANATAITKDNNQVTTVGAGSGVVLPTAVAGMRIFVRNAQATNALLVYPAVGGTINLLAANAAFSLALSTSAVFYAVSATQWYT